LVSVKDALFRLPCDPVVDVTDISRLICIDKLHALDRRGRVGKAAGRRIDRSQFTRSGEREEGNTGCR
jgi:hypothetical protein